MVDVQRIEPGPGQESVWDYPRPPAIEPTTKRLRVELAGVTIAETARGHRILETSQPPAFYFPREDVRMDLLTPSTTRTSCEWKGQAVHFSAPSVDDVAWSYHLTSNVVGPFKGGPGTAGW